MALYLSFDIGTTSLKTALVDGRGHMRAIHTEEYAFHSPRPDRAEMKPEAYWNAVVKGTAAVFAESKLPSDNLTGVGFSSQGQTFVPIGRSGKPLYDAIVWTDNRAQYIADRWESEWLSKDIFREISGYPWLPAGLTVFKTRWLAENAPEAYKAWKFLCLPDYLIYLLTGETATDHVMAQFSGFYNIHAGEWDTRLLQAAGIDAGQLPVVLKSGEAAGKVSANAATELGIPAGIPVCVGANDQICGAVGAGNIRTGIVSETTGTSLALIATTPSFLEDTRMVVGRHASKDLCFAMPFNNTSAIVLKWLRDLCAEGMDYDSFLSGVENIPPGSDGLSVLPHFAGTATPTFNPNARGALVGLALGHTKTHIARAIMESCACILQECLEVVMEHNLGIDVVRSLGGAARSDVWLRIKADMLGVPVERPECSDAASLGAAMLAAAGTGQFSSIKEASEAWYKPAQIFEPDESRRKTYKDIYSRYLDLYKRLYG